MFTGADRIVDAFGDILLAPQAVHDPCQPPLGTQVRGVAPVDQAVAAGMLLTEELRIFGGRAVAEKGREELRERVGLFVEGLQRIEARRREVEGRLIAEDRGRQRLAVAREDAAALRGDHLLGEDPPGQAVGVVGHLRAEELHPDEAPEHHGARQDEERIEQPHPQQDVAFDFRSFLLHRPCQFSMISPGAAGSWSSMPRARSCSTMAVWVVRW